MASKDAWKKEAAEFSAWLGSRLAYHSETWTSLSRWLNITPANMSLKKTGKRPWTMFDMAQACEFIGESYTIGGKNE